MNLLGGLDVPTEGGVWIRGKSLKDMVAEERTIFRRRNIGFVFQQYNLVPMLSVYENIVLPLWLDGTGIDKELFEEIVMLLGIQNQLERLPGTLSGGQQQRVAIARDFMTNPADERAEEPTGNRESGTGTRCRCARWRGRLRPGCRIDSPFPTPDSRPHNDPPADCRRPSLVP